MASPLPSPPTSLVSLPNKIFEQILLRAAEIRVQDVFSARMTCKTLNRVGNKPRFLKAVPFFDFDNQMPDTLSIGLIEFRKACAVAENPNALFLREISAYLFERSPEIGMAYIKKAENEGCSYARYAYEILRKQLYPPRLDPCGIVDDSIPKLTRESARSIRFKVTSLESDWLMFRPLPYYVTSVRDDIGLGYIKEFPCTYVREGFG